MRLANGGNVWAELVGIRQRSARSTRRVRLRTLSIRVPETGRGRRLTQRAGSLLAFVLDQLALEPPLQELPLGAVPLGETVGAAGSKILRCTAFLVRRSVTACGGKCGSGWASTPSCIFS